MKRFYLLGFSVLFLTIQTVFADMDVANNALARGDHAVAAAEFKKLAEQGNVKAQAHLGYMYYVGEGVEQDYVQAVKWYKKAAILGDRDSQYNLAVAHAFGEGTRQDYKGSFHWYRRAAEQNHVVAQYALGISYTYGEGISQDPKLAAEWIQKSAEHGYERAQVLLGSLYHTGNGVEKDHEKAVFWYRKAADKGNPVAQYNLGTLYRAGSGVEQNYNQAVRWFRLSADQGYVAAQNELAGIERAVTGANRTVPEVETTDVQMKTEARESVENTSASTLTLAKIEVPIPDDPAPVDSVVTAAEIIESTTPDKIEEITESEKPKRGFFSRLFGKDESDGRNDAVEVVEIESIGQAQDESSEVVTYAADSVEGQTLESPGDGRIEVAETEAVVASITPDETEEITESEKPKRGFFSRLFGKDESDGRNDAVEVVEIESIGQAQDESSEVVTYAADSVEGQTLESPGDGRIEVAETEAVVASITPDETEEITESEKPKRGFFSRLFGKDESDGRNDAVEVVEIESIGQAQDESSEVVTYAADSVEGQTLESPGDGRIEVAEAEAVAASITPDETEEITESEKPKRGFFSRLFGKDESDGRNDAVEVVEIESIGQAQDESSEVVVYTADSMPTGQVLETLSESDMVDEQAETVEAGIATQLPADIPFEEGVSEAADLSEPDLIDNDTSTAGTIIEEKSEEKIKKKGFFSRLFGGDEPDEETQEVVEIDAIDVPVVVAKLEAPEEDETTQGESERALVDTIETTTDPENTGSASELRSLAVRGDPKAQFQLGSLYYQGKSVKKDYSQAFLWYRRAAQQGEADAQYGIGNMYLLGEGIKQDDYQARLWFEKAADQGHAGALHNLRSLQRIATAEPIERNDYDISNNRLPKQDEAAIQEKETTEKKGFFGRLFGGDDDEADESRLIAEVVEETETDNGQMLTESMEVIRDRDTAVSVYETGLTYEFGEGVVQDYDTAFEFFKKSAEQNHAPAQYRLGLAYAYGQSTEKDPVTAAEWYKKSAAQGYALAQRALGALYINGDADGIAQNKSLALAWYDILADYGNAMDIYRRDSLKETLTADEISEANKLKQELSN